MSKRQPRFEICRGDNGYWARFRAANGRIVWVTETYKRRAAGQDAIVNMARAMHPNLRTFFHFDTIDGLPAGGELRVGVPGEDYLTAHRIEVRELDERS